MRYEARAHARITCNRGNEFLYGFEACVNGQRVDRPSLLDAAIYQLSGIRVNRCDLKFKAKSLARPLKRGTTDSQNCNWNFAIGRNAGKTLLEESSCDDTHRSPYFHFGPCHYEHRWVDSYS